MSTDPRNTVIADQPILPNGSGAAALLSAGLGVFALAILTLLGDKLPAVKAALIFYKATGALSGVSTLAVIVWLAIWAVLERRWRRKTVALTRILAVTFALLALSLLLTFPPVLDLF